MKSLSAIGILAFWILIFSGHFAVALAIWLLYATIRSICDTFKRYKERKELYNTLKPGAGISFND